MIEYIPAAMASLSAASKIISGLISIRDFSQYSATFTELQNHIIQANRSIISEQQAYFSLTAKVQELEKECVRLKNWSENERQTYSRYEIAPGIFAYVENDFVGKFQNAHKLCCNCFDNKAIQSTLQQSHEADKLMGNYINLTCPNGCPKIKIMNYNVNTIAKT